MTTAATIAACIKQNMSMAKFSAHQRKVSNPFHLFENPDHRVSVELAVFQHGLAQLVLFSAVGHSDKPDPSFHMLLISGLDDRQLN